MSPDNPALDAGLISFVMFVPGPARRGGSNIANLPSCCGTGPVGDWAVSGSALT